LPDAKAGGRIPAWLEAPQTAWMTQHVVMLPTRPNETLEAPVPLAPTTTLPLPSASPASAAPLTPAATPAARPTPATPPAAGAGVPR
jgi:hypothetical protein